MTNYAHLSICKRETEILSLIWVIYREKYIERETLNFPTKELHIWIITIDNNSIKRN